MKKLLSIMAGSLFFCTILIGCTGSKGCFSQYKCTEDLKNNSWKVSYEKFDGSKYINIKLKEEEVKPFKVDVESESGELDLIIRDGKNTVVFEEFNISTSSFEIPIEESGKYTIKFNGHDHKGSFNVIWK